MASGPTGALAPSDEFAMYEGLRATRDADACLRALNTFRRGLRGAAAPAFLARYLRASPEWQELQAVWDAQLTIQHYHVTVTLLLALADALDVATSAAADPAAAAAAPGNEPSDQRTVLSAGAAALTSALLHRRLKAIYFALSSDMRGKANAALALLAAAARACSGGAPGAPPLRDLVRAFDWSLSALPGLARPPREKKGESSAEHRQRYWQQWGLGDPLKRPTRALLGELALCLLRGAAAPAAGDPLLLHQLLQLRPLAGGLLAHLGADPPEQQLQVLRLLQKRVLPVKAAVPPAVQAEAFSDAALQQLATIAAAAPVEGAEEEAEDGEEDEGGKGAGTQRRAAAAAALEVLLAVATDPAHGLAALPAATAGFVLADAGSHQLQTGQRRLLRMLLRLRPADSAAHLQLLLATAAADAPLAAALLLALPYGLEPAAAGAAAGAAAVGRWFAHAAVASRLLQLLPSATPPGLQLLASGGGAASVPAPGGRRAQALLRCCFPPCLQKAALSRGLQHSNALVRYGTLGLLVSAMSALEAVLQDCASAASAAGPAQRPGWQALARWLQQAARQQLPDPTLLLALLAAAEKEGWEEANELQLTAVLRLLLLWQRLLPGALAESNVDAERLLPQQPLGLRPEHQLLLLELLLAAADTAGAADGGDSTAGASAAASVSAGASALLPVLRLLVGSPAAAVRGAAHRWLLRRLLASGAFGGNPEEATLWLDLLPSGGEAVAAFWAEALQLLLRRPHELFELQQALLGQAGVAASLTSGGTGARAAASAPQFSLLAPCVLRQLLRVLPSSKIPAADKAAAAVYVADVLRQLAQQQLGAGGPGASGGGEPSSPVAPLAAVLLGVVRQEAARQHEQQAGGSASKEKKRKGGASVAADGAAAAGPLQLPAEGQPLLGLLGLLEAQLQQQTGPAEQLHKKQKKMKRGLDEQAGTAAAAPPASCTVAVLAGVDGTAADGPVPAADACCLLISQLATSDGSSSGGAALLAEVQERLAASDADGDSGVGTCSAAARQCLHLLEGAASGAAAQPLLQALQAAVRSGSTQAQGRCVQLLAGSSLVAASLAADGAASEVQQAVGDAIAQLLHQLLSGSVASSAAAASAPLLQQAAAVLQHLLASSAADSSDAAVVAHRGLLLLSHMPAAAVESVADELLTRGDSSNGSRSSKKSEKAAGESEAALAAPSGALRAAAAAVVLQQLVAAGRLQGQPQRLQQALVLLLRLASQPASGEGSTAATHRCWQQLLCGPQRAAALEVLGSSGRQQLLRCCLAPGAAHSGTVAACSQTAALLCSSCAECQQLAAELLPPLVDGGGTCGLALALPTVLALLQQQPEQLPEAVLAALQQALAGHLTAEGASSGGSSAPERAKKRKADKAALPAADAAASGVATQLLQQSALHCWRLLLQRRPLDGKQRRRLLSALLPQQGWPAAAIAVGSAGAAQPGVLQQAEAAAALLSSQASVEELAACVRCFAATLAALLKLPAAGRAAELESALLALLDGPVGDAVAALPAAQRSSPAFAELAEAAAGGLGTAVLRHRLAAASDEAGADVAAAGVAALRVLRRFMAALLPEEEASTSDSDSEEDAPAAIWPQQSVSSPAVASAALQLLQRLLGHSRFLPAMRAAAASPPPLPAAAAAQPRPLASLLPLAAAADGAAADPMPASAAAKKELCELLETLLDLHYRFSGPQGAGASSSSGEAQQVAAAEAALLPLLLAGYGASCSPADCAAWSLAAAINQRQWRRQQGHAAQAAAAGDDADMEALAALLHGPLSESWFAWGPAAAALQQLRPGAGEDAEQRRRQLLQQRLALDPLRAALTVCHWPEACSLAAPGSGAASDDSVAGSGAGASSSSGGQLAQLPGCAAAYDPGFLLPFAVCCLRHQLLAPRGFAEAGLLSVCLRGLAAADAGCRAAAYQALALFEAQLPAGAAGAQGFREVPQFRVLLGALRAAVTRPFQRLPAVHAVFLAEAALLALHPGAAMYPAAMKHLTRRAVLNTAEVPLLGQLLLAGGQAHAGERRWCAQLLLAGLRGADDGSLYRRKHALELAMALHDSSVAEPAVASLALRLLCAATFVPRAARQLCHESGLIPWLAGAAAAALEAARLGPGQRGGSESDAPEAAAEALAALRRLLPLRAVMRGAGGAAAQQQMAAAACQLAAAARGAAQGRGASTAPLEACESVLPFLREVKQAVGGGGQARRAVGSERLLADLEAGVGQLQALLP